MSWCVKLPDGSWNCHPYWIPDAVEYPHAAVGLWPANYPPSLAAPGHNHPVHDPWGTGGGTPNPNPPPPNVIPVQPPSEGEDIPPSEDPEDGPTTGPPAEDPCEPEMLAYDLLESYLFRGERGGEGDGRRHGNTVDQLSMPIVGGLSFAALWDGLNPVYDHKPRFEFNVQGRTIRVFHEGQGPGVAVLHSPQLDDHHLLGSLRAGVESRWPTTISPGALLLLNTVRGDGNMGDAATYLLAMGRLLETTHKPGLGAYFSLQTGSGELAVMTTDANGDNDTAGKRLYIGDYSIPMEDGAPGQVLATDGTGEAGWASNGSGEEVEVTTAEDAAAATHMVDLAALLPDDGVAHFEAILTGWCIEDGDLDGPAPEEAVSARMVGVFKRVGSTVTQVGATVHAEGEGDDGWAAWLADIANRFFFDITSTTVSVNVAGIAQDSGTGAATYIFRARLRPVLALGAPA